MSSDANSASSTPRPASARDEVVTQTAADWVARRDRGLTPEQQRRLTEWENADPHHAREMERMGKAWHALDGITTVPELDTMADVVVIRARARQARRRRSFFWAVGSVAATVVLGIAAWRGLHPAPPALLDTTDKNYRVMASTLQRMTLPDGSVAELNGASRVEIDFTAAERRVRLTEGEAHFIVMPNPERPFYVSAGPVTVRAVGTAFNVRLASEVVEVLVTEGKVKLENAPAAEPVSGTTSAPRTSRDGGAEANSALVAGQRAVINRGVSAVQIGDVGQTEIKEALGWQSIRLVFNNTPLDEVVEGFNRYNSHRLTIGDPAVRKRTLTGVFRADNLEGFVRLLRHSIDIKAELRTPNETVLLPVR